MKLKGYYMNAVAKTDAVSLAGRLELPSDCEVF